MAEMYPDIEIVGPDYGAGRAPDAVDRHRKGMITANPDIKGFFGANEGSAIGVINAVTELDMVGDFVAHRL